ncbi:MAG: Glucose-6-phosphate dehydrogenase family protein [Chlamydiales bacterium]|nr:Glucose-6-phosphate dehydrogenase family protein [Chlamydiales bacterium]
MVDMLERMREFFPCKIIAIQLEECQGNSPLKKLFSEAEGNQKPSSEWVLIDASTSLESAPFKVLKELKADLPTYLFWGQDMAIKTPLLDTLESWSSRLIFNSEGSPHFAQMLRALEEHKLEQLIDLNWVKLGAWRQAIAQCFDTKEKLRQLSLSKTIHIRYNRPVQEEPSEILAIYLAGWLADRLSWSFQSLDHVDGNIRLTYSIGIEEVHLILSPQREEGCSASAILALEVFSHEDVHFLMKKEKGGIRVSHSSKDLCAVPYTITKGGQNHRLSLIHEIFLCPVSPHFKHTIKALANINWCP